MCQQWLCSGQLSLDGLQDDLDQTGSDWSKISLWSASGQPFLAGAINQTLLPINHNYHCFLDRATFRAQPQYVLSRSQSRSTDLRNITLEASVVTGFRIIAVCPWTVSALYCRTKPKGRNYLSKQLLAFGFARQSCQHIWFVEIHGNDYLWKPVPFVAHRRLGYDEWTTLASGDLCVNDTD